MKQLKKEFEKGLREYLIDKFKDDKTIKIKNNEIIIKYQEQYQNSSFARIIFDYSAKGRGYVTYINVYNVEIINYLVKLSPPYISPYRHSFSNFEPILRVNSLNLEFKNLSKELYGTFLLPKKNDAMEEAYEIIYKEILKYLFPAIYRVINADKELIDDIILSPNIYLYPFLTILYILKKYNVEIDHKVESKLLTKNLIINKKFDISLFNDINT